MGTEVRSETHDLAELLGLPPERVDPFQLLRWIERRGFALYAEERERREAELGPGASSPRMEPLGEGVSPEAELVRFHVEPTLRFPASAITRAEARLDTDEQDRLARLVWDVNFTFAGLVGPQGVLPQHYTATCQRREQSRDGALRDLLDLLHQRLLAFFYRAWRKYHLAATTEAERERGAGGLNEALLALAGSATRSAEDAIDLDADATVGLATYLGREVASAPAIEAAASSVAGVPARIESFVGRWVQVRPEDRGALGVSPDGAPPVALGQCCLLGDTAYDVTSRCRLHLGPVPYDDLPRFRPDRPTLGRLAQVAARMAGASVDVEFVLQVEREGARPPVLGDGGLGGRLGWSAWLVDPERPSSEAPLEGVLQPPRA